MWERRAQKRHLVFFCYKQTFSCLRSVEVQTEPEAINKTLKTEREELTDTVWVPQEQTGAKPVQSHFLLVLKRQLLQLLEGDEELRSLLRKKTAEHRRAETSCTSDLFFT